MKILIVYYSKTGKTKEIAHTMANELANGNEVNPALPKKYKLSEARKGGVKLRRIKMKNERNLLTTYLLDAKKAIRREKPEIEVLNYDHKDYDLILLGTPVWSANPAPAINTYLNRADFENKKVALFVTLRMMGGEKVIGILMEEIEKKGGKIIDSIIIKTGLFHKKEMIEKAKEFAKKLKS